MKIDNLRPAPYLPTGQEVPQAAGENQKANRTPQSASGDSIELSNNTLLAMEPGLPATPTDETQLLSQERLAEIRARTDRDFYTNPATIRQSADKIAEFFRGNPKK